LHQTSFHWISVQVAQFGSEFAMVSYVSVVVTLLPEGSRLALRSAVAQPFGERQFQIMQGIGKLGVGRFADEQVNMLGHHNVSVNTHFETLAHVFQTLDE